MTTWIALLRGVNLGKRRMAMADLKKLCEKLGFENVRTYIQSGNVVFESAEKDEEKLGRILSAAIEKKFGYECPVVLRTRAEIEQVIARNPFAKRKDVLPPYLAVVFLSTDPGKAAHAALARIDSAPDEIKSSGREIFIFYPNGQGRPTLKFRDVEKAIGKLVTTVRNLNTVVKLATF